MTSGGLNRGSGSGIRCIFTTQRERRCRFATLCGPAGSHNPPPACSDRPAPTVQDQGELHQPLSSTLSAVSGLAATLQTAQRRQNTGNPLTHPRYFTLFFTVCSDDFECIPQHVAKRRAAAAAAAAHDRTVHVSVQEKPETFFLNTCAVTGSLLAVWMRDEPMGFSLGLLFFHIYFTIWSGPGAVERQIWGPFA